MTERMNSSSNFVLDLSLPKSKDQEMVENSISIDESFQNSDEPQDFSVTRSPDGQIMFKTGDNERNFQQSLVPNKKGVPLNSATTLKRRGPVIDPYVPPSPHPKIRKVPPPLTTTGASPHAWNMTVKCMAQTTSSSAHHVISASPLGPQKQQPHNIPIGAFQVNKMRHLSNAATIQTPPRFHGPSPVAQFARFAPVNAQTLPANINPYNIAGVTPLIHRPSVAKPSTNPANVGILKAPAQRILLPGQRAPTTLIANQIPTGSQKPGFNYGISSTQSMAQSSSQGQHNLSNASSQSTEEMPRHNNPFMAPVGRQETVKQTRVAFRNSPEFSLVHVQHSAPVKQNNNLPHIMPKQAKLTHVAGKPSASQPMAISPQQSLGDQISSGRGNIQRPPFVSNTMNRPPLQIMRPARQVFPVSVNQSVSMFQKSTQQTTPHVYPQNQLNLLAYKKPQFAGNPNVQVVATPVTQIVPPQLSRASTLQNQNHLMPRGPPSVPTSTMRAQTNPQFNAQQVKESMTSMSQSRFLNPPNGVRPLVSKPLPTSQNIVQQQKIVASLAASLTSSSVLTSGPRFLNPQPPAQNQLAKHSINSTSNTVGASKSSMTPAMPTAPRLLNPFHPGAVVPPPPLVKAEEIASQSLSTPQQQSSSAAAHAIASSNKDFKLLSAANSTTAVAATASQNCSTTGKKITQERRADDAVPNTAKIKSEISQQTNIVPKTEVQSQIFSHDDLLDEKVLSYVKDLDNNNYEFKWLTSTEPEKVACHAAPDCCFLHLLKCKDDDLPENMVIEVPSNQEKGTWWVATILYSCRQHILIRYAGFLDARYDLWIDLQTTDIHPIGWCKKTGNRLEPPEHFPLEVLESETKHAMKLSLSGVSNNKEDEKSNKAASAVIKQEQNLDAMTQKSREFLRNFVVNKYSVHESFLEQRLFWPVEMRIPVNSRMEYEYEPRKIWLVRIINNYSGLLQLRYEGVPDCVTKHDLLLIYTSTKLHGVGYAIKSVNMLMEPPKFLWNYCTTQTEMVKSYQKGWAKNEELRVRMPKMFFEPINDTPKSINKAATALNHSSASDIRIMSLKGCLNAKLEVIFSKFPHLICVATVTEVIDDETFRATLDDCNKNGSKHSQVFNLSSFGLFPALWCSKKNVHLTPPLNFSYNTKNARTDFDWHDYLIENGTRCFPDYLLKPQKPKSKTVFEVGQKLEAINPFHPNQINPCTIKRVIDDKVLLLGIDDWVSSMGSPVTFFADAMGDSIFPARWCESVGYTIKLPWDISTEKRKLLDFDFSCVVKKEAIEENETENESLGKVETTESQCERTWNVSTTAMEFPSDVKVFSSVPCESDLKLYCSNFNHPFWCPEVYVNYGCCKSSLISRYKLSCLREHFGPGLSIYVIRAMLNALINCSFKPQQVFTQVYSACTHFESTGSSPAYIKAKCRNKNLRALVQLPEKLSEMKDFLICVLKKLGCCPDLFCFKYYEAKVCDSVDCVSVQNKTSQNELINDYHQPGSPNAMCSNRNKSNCKSKKRKKKKMLFSSQKRNTTQTKCSSEAQKSSCSTSVTGRRQLNNCEKSLIHKDGMISDGSLPNSRPVTPRSESPVDADLDKFIIVEPKRGFSKFKKGVVNGGVGNPPEREKSKRHKSVFSTVNMIARHELDPEDYLLQAAQSLIPLTDQQNEEFDFSYPAEKITTAELKDENESSVVSTSSACKEASKLNCSSQHKKSLALKKRKKVSTSVGLAGTVAKTSSKKTNKLRKLSFSSSQNGKDATATTNGATLADRKSIHKLKSAPSSGTATATKNQTRLLNTRSAKTLDKADPLKWSTEDLCLHLNTTECADFLPFIRKESIDGQSFILLTFTYLTDVCEIKKDLAAKVCYQVAKLKKQYLDDANITVTTTAASAISNCSYKYTEENSL